MLKAILTIALMVNLMPDINMDIGTLFESE